MTPAQIISLFGIAFVTTVVATPMAKWLGFRMGLIDSPDNYRKIHQTAIPLGGGIAVYFGFLIPLLLTFAISTTGGNLPDQAPDMVVFLMIAGTMAMLMGLADDLRNLKARWKVIFQVLAATLAFSGGFRVDSISNPFGSSLELGYFSYAVTLVWFLVCMNALNLVDGLDGLSAGIGFIVSVTLLGVNISAGNALGIVLNACLSGSLLGFLIFNFNPASIFLGDSGSMFIGFLIAAISLLTKHKAETATALLIPLMALGLPILDMALAVIRRWSRRHPISVADRNHIHHSLLSLGFSQRKAVVVLYIVSILFCAAAVIMVSTRSHFSTTILFLLVIAMIVGARLLRLVDLNELKERVKQDHEDHQWRKKTTLLVEKAVQNCQRQQSMDEVWNLLGPTFAALDLDAVSLHATSQPSQPKYTWQREALSSRPDNSECDSWRIEFNIPCHPSSKLIFQQIGPVKKMKITASFCEQLRDALSQKLGELKL